MTKPAKRKPKFRVGQKIVITNLKARIVQKPDVEGTPWTVLLAGIAIPVYSDEMEPFKQ